LGIVGNLPGRWLDTEEVVGMICGEKGEEQGLWG